MGYGNGKEIRTFSDPTSLVYSFAFSPDGSQIVSYSVNNRRVNNDQSYIMITLWDVTAGLGIWSVAISVSGILSLGFSPDATKIFAVINNNIYYSGSDEFPMPMVDYVNIGTIKIFDVATSREIITITDYSSRIVNAVFSPDGRQILSDTNNGMKLWDAVTGRLIKSYSFNSEHTFQTVESFAFNQDGSSIISGSFIGEMKLIDASTNLIIKNFPVNYGIISVAFSSDGRRIFSIFDNEIKIWDAATLQEIRSFTGHSFKAISSDGRRALSFSFREMIIWDITTGRAIARSVSLNNGEWGLYFSEY